MATGSMYLPINIFSRGTLLCIQWVGLDNHLGLNHIRGFIRINPRKLQWDFGQSPFCPTMWTFLSGNHNQNIIFLASGESNRYDYNVGSDNGR